MKNFFKKLSFVLAIAMVLTSVVPATTASAASKVQIELNGKAVTEVTAFFGGVVRNLDASKNGKAASGTWKVGNTKVATVDSKTGVITPVGEGTTKVAFTLKGEKKASASVYVKVRTRAAALHVYDPSEYATGARNKLEDTTIELNVGEDKELKVTMPISKKASNAGAKISTYFLYAESSDEDVVKVSASTKMYTRAVTLKPVAAGEATVTLFANQTTKANARANKYVKEAKFTVKVAGESKIASAEAVKVNKVEVKFNGAADKDTVLALTKGGNAVENTVAWNEDRTVATMTTAAKMTNGTYTVTATVADAKSTTTFDVVSQYVADIKVLNEVALTGDYFGNTEKAVNAYVYYKVLDQYEEDITASTSIRWATSTDDNAKKEYRNEGLLVLQKDKDFVYGEQIFVTGVYEKSGKSVSATLTVGTKQALHSIKMAGFVRKNSTEIVSTLPVGFKSGEYYLVFDALDQNDCVLKANQKYTKTAMVNFIPDNALLVKEIKADNTLFQVVVDGHTYNAVSVEPGLYVNKGGEVTITAIASNTGNKTTHVYTVGQNQILTSFDMDMPAGVLADGEYWEIPFTALDQNGEKITAFETLARKSDFNELTFSTGADSEVRLEEQNDGTAKLFYYDDDMAYSDSQATDGVDRPVSVTSVVVGGNSDNLMMYISDKARPEAISTEDMAKAYVEGDSYRVGWYKDAYNNEVKTLLFIDQYGRKMVTPTGTRFGYDFFTTARFASGIDFIDYTFDVVAEFKGTSAGNPNATTQHANEDKIYLGLNTGVEAYADTTNANDANGSLVVNFGTGINTAAPGQYSYTIVKKKATKDWENVSPEFIKAFTVVDLKQVRSFEIADLPLIGITTDATYTGTTLTQYANVTDTLLASPAAILNNGTVVKNAKVKVTGKYNNIDVVIPADYFLIEDGILGSADGQLGSDTITKVVSLSAIRWSWLYDVKSPNYARKAFETEVKVTLKNIHGGGDVRDTVVKKASVTDAAPYLAVFNAPEALTYNATLTKLTGANILLEKIQYYGFVKVFYDQYGNALDFNPNLKVSYKLSKAEEAKGYVDNNFSVSQNDSAAASARGAELGDTFVLTITAEYNGSKISKDIKVTLGADATAYVSSGAVESHKEDINQTPTNPDDDVTVIDWTGKNSYMTRLIGDGVDGLEKQRTDSLN